MGGELHWGRSCVSLKIGEAPHLRGETLDGPFASLGRMMGKQGSIACHEEIFSGNDQRQAKFIAEKEKESHSGGKIARSKEKGANHGESKDPRRFVCRI